jgi:hypothetical protein
MRGDGDETEAEAPDRGERLAVKRVTAKYSGAINFAKLS